MLGNIGIPTLILILVVALLMFGPNKLPELGRAFGKTLREFKKGAKEMIDEEEQDQTNVQRVDVSKSDRSNSSDDNRRLPE